MVKINNRRGHAAVVEAFYLTVLEALVPTLDEPEGQEEEEREADDKHDEAETNANKGGAAIFLGLGLLIEAR